MKKSFIIYGSVIVVVIIVAYFLFARNKGQSYNFRFDKVTQGDLDSLSCSCNRNNQCRN